MNFSLEGSWAVSLCLVQPQAIGASVFMMNHPDIECRAFIDCSGDVTLCLGTDASIGPQFVSQ